MLTGLLIGLVVVMRSFVMGYRTARFDETNVFNAGVRHGQYTMYHSVRELMIDVRDARIAENEETINLN